MTTNIPTHRLLVPGLAILCAFGSLEAQETTPPLDRELETVRAVFRTSRFQSAMAYVEQAETETVQEWLSLCNADGPSGQEGGRSRLLYKLFRIYGLERVHINDALNVIGVRPGSGDGPAVVLNSHHDNVALSPVHQPVEGFVADGRVWCPAAFDDLGGTVQMLTVLRAMNPPTSRRSVTCGSCLLPERKRRSGPSTRMRAEVQNSLSGPTIRTTSIGGGEMSCSSSTGGEGRG